MQIMSNANINKTQIEKNNASWSIIHTRIKSKSASCTIRTVVAAWQLPNIRVMMQRILSTRRPVRHVAHGLGEPSSHCRFLFRPTRFQQRSRAGGRCRCRDSDDAFCGCSIRAVTLGLLAVATSAMANAVDPVIVSIIYSERTGRYWWWRHVIVQ